jgi:hypothetical protein
MFRTLSGLDDSGAGLRSKRSATSFKYEYLIALARRSPEIVRHPA